MAFCAMMGWGGLESSLAGLAVVCSSGDTRRSAKVVVERGRLGRASSGLVRGGSDSGVLGAASADGRRACGMGFGLGCDARGFRGLV